MKIRALVGLLFLAAFEVASGQGTIQNWRFEGVITKGIADGQNEEGRPYAVWFHIDRTRLVRAPGAYYPTVLYGYPILAEKEGPFKKYQ